ncbi:chromosome partitioning protein ParA [Candidatus Aerophobetes bacterium]|uniref:Chromosome partitioning protein ParA n=1 Tax=Aerophobetes bacterium TaxID=2030807 RepID=A0A2A4X2S0_UNCAE|nr:MAG: chromosome partitioning protein ParA [Candidatus Aerophobetes bacterium]
MKILTVSSFKGGTAKTSIALNIGAALARFYDKKILYIDFDAQANLTAGLGFDPDTLDSLAPALQGEKTIGDVIVKTEFENIDLIPADTWLERVEVTGALAQDRYSHEKLKTLLKEVDYDLVIIDTPPSLCWLTESALIACTHALVCSTPEFYSIKGLQRLSYFMHYIAERHPFEVLGVILSFFNHRGKNNEAFLNVIEEAFPGKILSSKIRRDIAVTEASICGKSLFDVKPGSRAAIDFKCLCDEINSLLFNAEIKETVCQS